MSTTYIQVPCDILHTIVIMQHHTTPSLSSKRCPDAKCIFHQRSLGRHKMDNRPTDSAGNLCGEGENAGKPFTFYFDVTQCAKLDSTSQPCPSTQVKKTSITNQKPFGKGVCVRVSRRLQHLHPGKMIFLQYSVVMQTNNNVPWINVHLYLG